MKKTEVLEMGSCDIKDIKSQEMQARSLIQDISQLDPTSIQNFIGIVIHRSEEDSPTHESRIYAMGAPDDILDTLEKLNHQLMQHMVQATQK
jgi:hypothetical protein